MPRRLNSEGFFYLNVRHRFNQKARAQFPISNFEQDIMTQLKTKAVRTCLTLSVVVALTSIINEAAAQTQPQSSTASPNVPAAQASAAANAPAAAPVASGQGARSAATTPVATTSVTAAPTAPPSVAAAPAATPTGEPVPAPSAAQLAAGAAALAAAQDAYIKGDYAAAEQHFRAAFAAIPSAKAQYGIASSLDLQAKPSEAFQAFTDLLARPDQSQLAADELTNAQARLSALGRIPATVRLAIFSKDQAVPNPKVLVDNIEQSGTERQLPAGKHLLQIQASGYQGHEQTLDLKPAQVLDLAVELVPVPAPVTPPAAPVTTMPEPALEEAVPPASKVPAYVTLGVAGGAAIAGTVFGLNALSAQDTFDNDPTVAHADDVERNALIADMAFGIAFTLGITGIVLLVTDEPTEPAASSPPQTALQVVPYVTTERGGAVARLTW